MCTRRIMHHFSMRRMTCVMDLTARPISAVPSVVSVNTGQTQRNLSRQSNKTNFSCKFANTASGWLMFSSQQQTFSGLSGPTVLYMKTRSLYSVNCTL